MYRSTDAGAAWELVSLASLTGGGDGLFVDARPSEQPVCYRVVAYNAGGDAAPSGRTRRYASYRQRRSMW